MQYECENCEAPLTTGWLVCPQCGEKFDSPVPEYVDTVTPSETLQPVRYDLAGNELPPAPTVSPAPIAPPKIPIYEEREWMPQAASVKPKFYEEWTFLPNSPLKIGAVVGLILMIWGFNTWQHRRYVASEGNYEQNGASAAVASPVPPPSAQTTPQAPATSAPLVLMAPKPVPQYQPQKTAPSFENSMSVQSADNQTFNATAQADQQMEAIYQQACDAYSQVPRQGSNIDEVGLTHASLAVFNARKQMQALAPQTSPSRQSEFLEDYFRLNIYFNETTYASLVGHFSPSDMPMMPPGYAWGSEV